MAKTVLKTVRPTGGWSLPIDTETTRVLHERFCALSGTLDKGDLMLIVRKARGEVLKHEIELDDGYVPFACAEFSAGATLGDVLVVFPFCADTACEDGDMADRAVSVHSMGEVPCRPADEIVRRLIEAMPIVVPAPAPSLEDVESVL